MTHLQKSSNVSVVGQAGSTGEALMLAANMAIDVMLVDIGLQTTTGIFLTASLRARHPTIRVVIVSTHDKAAYVANAVSAGAQGYVLKNPEPDEIIAAVTEVAKGGTYFGAGVRGSTQAHACRTRRLTPREREVMCLVAQGLTNEAIAQRLGISLGTVMRHRLNFRSKLSLGSAVEISRYAKDQGFLVE